MCSAGSLFGPAQRPRLSPFSRLIHLIREAFPKQRRGRRAGSTVRVTVAMLDDCKCVIKSTAGHSERQSGYCTPGETLGRIGKREKNNERDRNEAMP